jgi:hypothetical protein
MFPFFSQTKIEKLLAGRTEHLYRALEVVWRPRQSATHRCTHALASKSCVLPWFRQPWRGASPTRHGSARRGEEKMRSGLMFLVSGRDHRPRDGPPTGQDDAPSLAMAASPCSGSFASLLADGGAPMADMLRQRGATIGEV